MAETDAVKNAINDTRKGQGTKITYHTADPGKNGANLITTTPASATTTWGASSVTSEISESVGSEVQMSVPASTTVAWIGQWNGATFLRGWPLDSSIGVGSGGAVPVAVTPKLRYTGNT